LLLELAHCFGATQMIQRTSKPVMDIDKCNAAKLTSLLSLGFDDYFDMDVLD
jgi:hypothetical protein